MNKITKEEIISFIESQSPERKVNMAEGNSDCECGCVMVHYGREVLGIDEYFTCGFHNFSTYEKLYTELELSIKDIVSGLWMDIKTYGDIQNRLKTTPQ